jgi:hypothetical protein
MEEEFEVQTTFNDDADMNEDVEIEGGDEDVQDTDDITE